MSSGLLTRGELEAQLADVQERQRKLEALWERNAQASEALRQAAAERKPGGPPLDVSGVLTGAEYLAACALKMRLHGRRKALEARLAALPPGGPDLRELPEPEDDEP